MSHKLSMPPSASERDGRTLAQLTARTRENSPCPSPPSPPASPAVPAAAPSLSAARSRVLRRAPSASAPVCAAARRAHPAAATVCRPRRQAPCPAPRPSSAGRARAGPPARSATRCRKANGQMTGRPRLDRMAELCRRSVAWWKPRLTPPVMFPAFGQIGPRLSVRKPWIRNGMPDILLAGRQVGRRRILWH